MKRKIFILIIGLIISANSFAQENSSPSRIGLYGAYGFNSHTADFNSLTGLVSCCPDYKDASGSGLIFGAIFEQYIASKLYIGVRLGYYSFKGEFENDEIQTVYDYTTDDAVDATFRHNFNPEFAYLSFQPELSYNPIAGLMLRAGVRTDFLNISSDFDHSETIINPEYLNYENGTNTRLNSEGEIEDLVKTNFSVTLGLGYDIALSDNNKFYLTPEISYQLGLTDIVKDKDWKVNIFTAGLSFKYAFGSESDSHSPIVSLSESGTSSGTGNIRAMALTDDGNVDDLATVRIEEFKTKKMKPLLNYIFFDENSARIPERYKRISRNETSNFSEQDLSTYNDIQTYYHILNILGKRMKLNPDAKISVDGCNSNSGLEKDNLNLSVRRALAVRNYLIRIWDISPDRIIVDKRGLPANPSAIDNPDGMAENRRVEINSDKWEIIAPVYSETTSIETKPAGIRFETEIEGNTDISEWNIDVLQNGRQVKTFSGRDAVPGTIDWKISGSNSSSITNDDLLTYKMTMSNGSDIFTSNEQTIPVEYLSLKKKVVEKLSDISLYRFSLLSSFDENELSPYNKKLMDMIKAEISPESEITVAGYTDRLGTENYNKELSEKRAKALADEFSASKIETVGYGESRMDFDNNNPEGRFYSRRVDVTISTPR